MIVKNFLQFFHHYPIDLLKTTVGGGERDRTDDLMLAKHALSQLSYTPDSGTRNREPGTRRIQRIHKVVTPLKCICIFLAPGSRFLEPDWWAREDLNLRPHAYQACALTN